MKIAVFDSGVGGKSFLKDISVMFPDAKVDYREDKKNIPYGNKSPEKLLELTLPIFKSFDHGGYDAVLVACNTVTTNIIDELRKRIKTPLIGVEPMIRPASIMTKTGNIAVCATSATLKSNRYIWLKKQNAKNINVIEPYCDDWAYMIEEKRQNELELKAMIEDLRKKGVDVLVLGCTHYHWVEKELQKLAGKDIKVIQPIESVLKQLKRVIEEN